MNNLLLYGSVARKDNEKNSDIDLLSIGQSQYVKKTVKNNVNLTQYPHDTLLSMAHKGSLFIYHLKEEGEILVDDNNRFQNLFHVHFRLRESYNIEKIFAFQLLKKINVIYRELENIRFANSKIVWCFRTIFAAIGAEYQEPVFSKKKIEEKFGKDWLKILSKKQSKRKYAKDLEDSIIKIEPILGKLYSQTIPEDLLRYERKILKILNDKEYLNSIDCY